MSRIITITMTGTIGRIHEGANGLRIFSLCEDWTSEDGTKTGRQWLGPVFAFPGTAKGMQNIAQGSLVTVFGKFTRDRKGSRVTAYAVRGCYLKGDPTQYGRPEATTFVTEATVGAIRPYSTGTGCYVSLCEDRTHAGQEFPNWSEARVFAAGKAAFEGLGLNAGDLVHVEGRPRAFATRSPEQVAAGETQRYELGVALTRVRVLARAGLGKGQAAGEATTLSSRASRATGDVHAPAPVTPQVTIPVDGAPVNGAPVGDPFAVAA